MMKPKRTWWTEELFDSQVKSAIAHFGRMPTHSEMQSEGFSPLSWYIKRRSGGIFKVASDYGVARLHSASDTGSEGELDFAELLRSKGFTVEKSTIITSPFDLLVNGVVRVDVKSTRYVEREVYSNGWFYRTGKIPQSDVIALYQLDTKDVVLLNWVTCPRGGVTIIREYGKYKPFLNRYDIIWKLVELREREQLIWK